MKNGDSKWQLAFWVITVICGVWMVTLTGGVVNNDRIRATEDQRIEDKVDYKLDKLITIQTDLKVNMGRVMTRLGIRDERINSGTD